jgi:phenylpropionate dioxygenase-like ring-hydroxylating dioxygenase large terminal subunit
MAVREPDLREIGPILSDGTPVGDLVDVERRETSLRLLSDPEVFRLEQKLLFEKVWQLVGHETEIPDPGDFVLRQIAKDPVIVTRDREGRIRVLLNVCTHRGAQVCRSACGNATSFKCSYHGWAFGNEGNLLAAPFEKEMYGPDWDKSEYGLRQARVETYAGLIFANWSDEAPGLDEFLGDYKWYLDCIYKRTKAGLEMLGAPQRFVIKANWKAAGEQFNGSDGYHAVTLHRSLMDTIIQATGMDYQSVGRMTLDAVDIGCREGHGLRCFDVRSSAARFFPDLSPEDFKTLDSMEILSRLEVLPPELLPDLLETMTPGQLRTLATYSPGAGGIFPNVGFGGAQIRVFVPLSPGRLALVNWPLVEKGASAEYKRQTLKQMLGTLGTSGTIEQDDADTWPGTTVSAEGSIGEQGVMRYRGFSSGEPPEPGWGGGCETYTGFSKDDSAWNFWLRYRDYMTGTPW